LAGQASIDVCAAARTGKASAASAKSIILLCIIAAADCGQERRYEVVLEPEHNNILEATYVHSA
jgi:hypothetical protein